jgi:hypothetical protein
MNNIENDPSALLGLGEQYHRTLLGLKTNRKQVWGSNSDVISRLIRPLQPKLYFHHYCPTNYR